MPELDPANGAPSDAFPTPPPELDAAAAPPVEPPLGQFDPRAIQMAGEQLGNLLVLAIGTGFKMAGALPTTPDKEAMLKGAAERYAAARPELILKLMRWTPEVDFFGTIIFVITTAEMAPTATTFAADAIPTPGAGPA